MDSSSFGSRSDSSSRVVDDNRNGFLPTFHTSSTVPPAGYPTTAEDTRAEQPHRRVATSTPAYQSVPASSYLHNTQATPMPRSTSPEAPVKIEHTYEYHSEEDTYRQALDSGYNTTATSFSLSPTLRPSIEHDDDDDEFESSPSLSPEPYHTNLTAANLASPNSQRSCVTQSPSPVPSHSAAEHQRRGSNKRVIDFDLSSLPLEFQRAVKKQRTGDISETSRLDETYDLNFTIQPFPFLPAQYAGKRSHAQAEGTDPSEYAPGQVSKKRRTQKFSPTSSRTSPSLRSLPDHRQKRFSLRDFLRMRNRSEVDQLDIFQYDGASDSPSANDHGDHERETSRDTPSNDDEASPAQNNVPGERAQTPDSLFGDGEPFEEDDSSDTAVTLPESSTVEKEPANPPQATTPPVQAQDTNKPTEVATSEPASLPPALLALMGANSTAKYESPYAQGLDRVPSQRAQPAPANLHQPGVEAATTREQRMIDRYRNRIAELTKERDAARRKLTYWDSVDPVTGKSREQMLKAEPLRLTRALNAQEKKTEQAQKDAEEYRRLYNLLVGEYNVLFRKYFDLVGGNRLVHFPTNQEVPGPSQDGSRPVVGTAPGSTQRRPMPPPGDRCAGGAPAVANPERGQVSIDLTGEGVGAATPTQHSVPRPEPSGAPAPGVVVPTAATTTTATDTAPTPPTRRPRRRAPAKSDKPNARASIPPRQKVDPTQQAATEQQLVARSGSPEAEELRTRFQTKDYSWLQGFNHMTNRRKPAFGPDCVQPCAPPPVIVPAHRFRDAERTRARARAKSLYQKRKEKKALEQSGGVPALVTEGEASTNGPGVSDDAEAVGSDWERDLELEMEFEFEFARIASEATDGNSGEGGDAEQEEEEEEEEDEQQQQHQQQQEEGEDIQPEIQPEVPPDFSLEFPPELPFDDNFGEGVQLENLSQAEIMRMFDATMEGGLTG
ncbi:hypothetical protein FQN54_002089 [Arachnomyces sp. PD_36]|nr:hypothetical protein FQN54_002089 [Arachnomyces sp. PD_36]